ncbi:heparan N-sulfatase [Flavilitoribacter nigricans DSM 23189 = NBRC 102662]|uniref:Heparan N-sulfatase n=1 Tax=Flavilitoribacter nigricans (strain ATCC 23147 / DSM 23189 / NBRC 102662 / NCIMB 1420 / SS-2) TaxID=1122177 RepID=A0A2D0NKR8_FLAN2|nr:heparan N-sulfatase [Flavilitoribacter nigricans DSM 23189 = NBRC 102662]
MWSCQPQAKEELAAENLPEQPNILFLIADDWSFPHAGVYGDQIVRTPTFDRLAREGAVFSNAYCAAPSCAPSRAAVLTGRYPHQLESAGNLWSIIPDKFPNWVSLLTEAGYFSGKTRKGWAPGDFERGGYTHNPAGKDFGSFREFFTARPKGQPFCFWFGSTDPHRTYVPNTGIHTGMPLESVQVPGFMPDVDCVRNDILDYYFEVERFDRECGQILQMLEAAGELDNTIIVMTSDNGMPFPRAKANLYDYGTRMPLAIRYPPRVSGGTDVDAFVNFVDFAPSFLEAAGLEVPDMVSGESLWPLLSDPTDRTGREQVFLERERHANVRKGDLSYPMRAVRNDEFLYIRNLIPDRWPAGDPSVYQSVGQWGDVDNSISKYLIMDMEGQTVAGQADFFQLTFGKRPEEELYAVSEDPFQLKNLATDPAYADVLAGLRTTLDEWMTATDDIRATEPQSIYWDTVLYTPNYQFKNFELAAEIDAYKIDPLRGPDIPCK